MGKGREHSLIRVMRAVSRGDKEIVVSYPYDPSLIELVSKYLSRAGYKIVSILRSNGEVKIKAFSLS